MVKKLTKRLLPVLLAVMMLVSVIPMGIFTASAAAKAVTVLDGKVSVTGTSTTSVSSGTVTATAKGGILSQTTNTLTIKNETTDTATLSFDYSASNYKSFSQSSASGTYSVLLEGGASVTISITSKASFSTATLKLSNFNLVVAASSSKVTFNFDSALGSITVGGTAVSSGYSAEVALSGVAVVATPASGATFLGWINEADNTVLSTAASFTLTPGSDMTAKAVFINANSKPHFALGTTTSSAETLGILGMGGSRTQYKVSTLTHIFDDLNTAGAAAASSTSKTMVLLNSSTLPAGDYTIPSGVTLLIPFDSANTMYTTAAYSVPYKEYKTPYAYRTLTMANGANITVNGAISVSGKHQQTNGAKVSGGSPTGAVGFIDMNEDSKITVNGSLYAYGYIVGSGNVIANSGAKVYENFQMMDFRGGDQSTRMDNRVFVSSQYYVQNIEVPMILYSGATEHSYTTVNMQGGNWAASVGFIAKSGAMFNLTSGYVTKRYDGATDRLIVEANGNIQIAGVSMDMGLSDINSKDYVLPINNNITVKVNSGSTISVAQDVAMLPGTQIIVEEGATCTVEKGYNIYLYDADDWGAYCGATNKTFIPITYAPGMKYTRTEADLVDALILVNGTVNATAGHVYSTSGGANVYSTGNGVANIAAGTNTVTYQITQAGEVADSKYTAIPVTTVKLKNADGSYFQTATDTYTYDGSKWVCTKHNYTSTVTEPTCDTDGYTTHNCDVCGHSYTDSVVSAGHNFSTVVTDPTCTEKGFTTYTCVDCGYSYVDNYVDVVPHTYNETVTAPTCTEKGFTTFTCTACGHTYKDNYVDALGHTFGGWTTRTAATCVAEGLEYRACKCGHEETQVIEATGHSYSDEWTVDVEPTDLAEGSKSHHCANCDAVSDVTVVPALTNFIATVADGKATVTGYKGDIAGALSVPAELDGNTVVAIADKAFADNEGLSVIGIPGSIESISATAFDGCAKLVAVNYNGTIAEFENVENSIEGIRINYLGENIGDLNADGAVNATDLTCIIRYVLEGGELDEVQSYVYDANADGIVNLIDLVRIKKYLAGKSDILGHETAYETEEVVYSVAAVNSFYSANVATVSTDEPSISDYETFIAYSNVLEEVAYYYMLEVDGSADPIDLYVKYIRTGVDRYNTGSWGIMAGYENADFVEVVQMIQDASNEGIPEEEWIYINSLKNINNFYLPNGEYVDFGHMFGTMDMTYHNKGSKNHADVGGWAGDIVDLLTATDEGKVTGTIEEMVAEIGANYLNKEVGENGKFSQTDMYGDLDALYIMNELDAENYFYGDITKLMMEYFTEDLSMEDRAEYFIENRMDGISLRSTLRDEVYNVYTGNMVISTLEGTREFTSSNLDDLRKACCYAFADYICKLAGDYVDSVENNYFEVFSTTPSTLAPGVTQEIKYATTADNKQIVYYLATADLTRDDVNLYANYKDNDPASGWGIQTVLDQANAAQNKYGNPESEHYIENYNVIVSTNGAGFNMSTGEPGGLLVMGGVEYHAINSNGFVGVLKNGKPVIGTTEEYNTIYKDQVAEGIAVFGATLVKDGKIVVTETTNYYDSRASRTAIGITKTGKVVMMVLDGRQEPISCGGSMIEIAQIMLDAGCVHAVNLDGGGSTTYVAKAEGADELAVINRPSDGYARSVSTSLMIVSTAPSSTAFDHAVIDSDYDYLTVGSSINLTASGVSATGNAAELPEGTYWVISDESIAVIDENGVLTAKTNGTVNVYLMLGEEALAVKPIGVVVPDNVYFTKNSVNAVYGSKLSLPIKVTYMAKSVAYNANDVVLSLNNKKAGVFDGLIFIGDENGGVKNVTITVALKTDSDANDTMLVALFSQGEAVFDFEQATGGDKEMAWDRVITNTTTDDGIIYNVVDSDADMVTSYTFAIDMSKIGIPDRLSDLTYMLPGAGTGDATAWNFLCQLAERVSTLTEVKATIKFDSNFIVDYSKLTVVNDYFIHTNTEFDEATNTLVVTLKWIDQTEPIDPTMANPVCIVSGVKLTPKADAQWGADDKLVAVNSGDITYDIYLRASALYTFACKEENQQQFGLFPFINPDLPSEKGGHFSSVYKEFEDTYTLVKARKNGWANEDGGFVYYVEGERLTGVNMIDGYYYDFGESGINAGQTKYSGVFLDKKAGVYRYSKIGVITTGWQFIDSQWYYFHSSTKAAATGLTKVNGVRFNFEENGKLKSGSWVNTLDGVRYYYGPDYYRNAWETIDGNQYYFATNGSRAIGVVKIRIKTGSVSHKWYSFDENGVCLGAFDGIHEVNGVYYYIEQGVGVEKYLIEYNGNYYFATYDGKLVTGRTINAFATNCDLPKGTYTFGDDGKMIGSSKDGEIIEIDGKLYYYECGKGVEKGLFKYEGDYYFALYKGELITNKIYNAYLTNCDLPKGKYAFGSDGKMIQGIIEKDGVLYYYENGVGVEKGLFYFDGDYYFAAYRGELVVNKICTPYLINCDLPKGRYEFGADGKMLQGVVEKDGVLYYYENGVGVEKGLFKYEGNYYFAAHKGQLVVNKVCTPYLINCDLPKGRYEFGADGKMIQGIVEKDGVLYYYENGVGVEKGLFKYEGDYYFAAYKGQLVVNKVCSAYLTNCDLPKGKYEFGADGKMLQGIVEKNGVLYYYENGVAFEKGLFYYEGAYYFAAYRGEIVVGKVLNAYLTNCDLPKGKYEFGADGKMLQGIVEKDGVLYYYENGVGVEKGLFYYEGAYYFAAYRGEIVVGKVLNAYLTNCDLSKGRYEFGSDGKMLQGIVEKDGVLYYYENGVGVEKGLFYYEGHYYFAVYRGELITNRVYKIYEGNGLLLETTYTFNELGQIVD